MVWGRRQGPGDRRRKKGEKGAIEGEMNTDGSGIGEGGVQREERMVWGRMQGPGDRRRKEGEQGTNEGKMNAGMD